MLQVLDTSLKFTFVNNVLTRPTWRRANVCMHMNFDRGKSQIIEQPLKLNSNIIKRVETYKYLGDLKDNKTSLGKNIENRRNSANAVINEIKFLTNQAPFKAKSKEICIKLIECIVIRKVLYGCETWSKIPKK